MKIYNLNKDVILDILIFLDLESMYRLKCINKFFFNYFNIGLKNISYVGFLIQNTKELKFSYIINPDYRTFKILINFKNSTKKFRNYKCNKNKFNLISQDFIS